MSQNSIQVIDGDGWQREFPLQKNLIHVGSDPLCDVVLDARRGAGVASRHLQLIAMPGDAQRYRAVNLGNDDIMLGDSANRTLSPRSMVEIAHGERLRVGDFTLVFRLGRPAVPAAPQEPVRQVAPAAAVTTAPVATVPIVGADETSTVIGLNMSLSASVLELEQPLDGIVTVRNQGNEPGVQFKLELLGLEPDCYELGPAPILFPNVEKGVFLTLRHPNRSSPPAGRHQIRIRATAPEAYPGESATVSREIEIMPYYRHSLRLLTAE
jgi:hypothetical protein